MPRWLIRLIQALARPFEPAPVPAPIPEPTPSPMPTPEPIPPVPPVETTGLAIAINAARASADLPPLAVDISLDQIAASWARSMASGGSLGHGPFADRVGSVYPNAAAGEDIAEGQPSPAEVVAAWMDDPPHRANILGPFDRLGVGLARADDGTLYWCADFVRAT